MSAPKTNIETQKRWHKGPLIGMAVVVTFALTLFFWLSSRTAQEGQPLQGETTQIDGRTGNEVEPTPASPAEVPTGDPVAPGPDLPPEELPNPAPPPPIPNTGGATP